MRFPGRVKKEGKSWLVEIPAFDVVHAGANEERGSLEWRKIS